MGKQLKVHIIIAIIPILSFILYSVISADVKDIRLDRNSRITIGHTLGSKFGFLEYVYSVGDDDYRKTQYEPKSDGDSSSIDKLFYVRFDPKDPNYSEILLDSPVASYFNEAPPYGWSKIPNFKSFNVRGTIKLLNVLGDGCELQLNKSSLKFIVETYNTPDSLDLAVKASIGDSISKPANADKIILITKGGEKYMYPFK